ncbi:MAG: C25 family peptidase C-terminal domain-containing protein, partial [Saprospiraceae bacterium]
GNQSAISPTPGDETADKPGNPQSSDLTAVMNSRGVSLYNYTGHGWEQGLVSGNFDVGAVGNLTNKNRYPVIIAVACCAGHFTSNTGDCLGEVVQRAGNEATGEPYGAICGFFSSDYQSWAPPMEGQDGMNQYLVDADGVSLTPAMSAMLAVGNAKMIIAYGQGGELMADFWNPFTDPTTMPRTRLPQPIVATHLQNVFIGTNSLTVTCDVEGALVSIYWQGEPIGVGIVAGGVATINFPSLGNVGDLTVTATQFNHIPYQGTVTVTPSAGPFVVSQSIVLDDVAGDGDQKADFGETVRLNVKLANVGLVPATATSLTISTLDEGVTLTDSEEIFGEIEDSTSVERTAAFAFTVDNNVPDGKVINFKLSLTFSDSMGYDFGLPVKLQAPALSIGGLVIDDTGSGNGNGRLDGGETALVRIQNFNTGKSQSPAAVGTLSSNSPWLTISQPFNLGQLAATNGTSDAVFTVKVAADAPQSKPVVFDYQAVAGAYSATKKFGGQLINAIVEDWENHNFTTFPWQMSGAKPWIITVLDVYDGQYCSRSGAISHSQKSQMHLTINVLEPGMVSFARRVMSEADYDFLHFMVDDQILESWSGQEDWAEVSFPISAGLHKLTWSYEKDEFGTDNPDKAWVDNIILPPHETVVSTKNAPAADVFGMSVAPNPIANAAFVSFELAENQDVSLVVADLLGRPVRSALAHARRAAGPHTERLDLAGLPAGIYLVQL